MIRLRWWLADKLDHFPGFCWANLVSWVQGDKTLRETRDQMVCRIDVARNGHCYCNKIKE